MGASNSLLCALEGIWYLRCPCDVHFWSQPILAPRKGMVWYLFTNLPLSSKLNNRLLQSGDIESSDLSNILY